MRSLVLLHSGINVIFLNIFGILAIFFLLAGCSPRWSSDPDAPTDSRFAGPLAPLLVSGRPQPQSSGALGTDPMPPRQGYVQEGSGRFVDAEARRPTGGDLRDDGRTVTLNFSDAEVAHVARVFFEEIVGEPVAIEPGIQGRITLRTPTPVSRPRALSLVREALSVHGAQVTRAGEVWRVSNRGRNAAAGGREGSRIVRLNHISADEAKAALAAIAGPGTEIGTIPGQQAIVVSGPGADTEAFSDAVRAIDVDQMRGMSVALLPLREAQAATVATEIERIVGRGQTSESRSFQVIPVARMNALLVVARRPGLLAEARRWAARLDQSGREGRRIFVYALQNRRAADVSKVLADILARVRDEPRGSQGRPPISPATIPVASPAVNSPTGFGVDRSGSSSTAFALPASGEVPIDSLGRSPRESSDAIGVSADIATNSVVVIARAEDRPMIEAAIRRLDVVPAQVLIEATIAEVRLGQNLRHGVRWYFESHGHSASLTDSNTGSVSPVFPGLNYTLNLPRARIILNALEQITDVKVVSSPALTVLDNQTARLQVGDQVPIATRSARSVINPDAPVVNDIEFRDTGVILAVTPRVNASGLVVLDIVQEVSDVTPTTTSAIDSPTIVSGVFRPRL